MALITTFLLNLLCSVVSCDSKYPMPEIIKANNPNNPRSLITAPISKTGVNILGSESNSIFRAFLSPESDPPFVTLPSGGRVLGYAMRTRRDREIFAFEGIPYAEKPKRWKNPIPIEPWSGVLKAHKPGPECLQLSLRRGLRVVGDEDCLFGNVYTPINPNTHLQAFQRLLPVIVVIHGGNFYSGSGDELGPSYLLDKDVLMVTFNYRLGVLGFLSYTPSTPDNFSQLLGNYGLRDQTLFLHWVKKNIIAFGGDPERITLLGHNSGAASAHLHLFLKESSNLFSNGVSLSGSALSHWALKTPEEGNNLTSKLAKALNCPPTLGEKMVSCLETKSSVDLVSGQWKLMEFSPFPMVLFSPVIEDDLHAPFISKMPAKLYRRKRDRRPLFKPWIFGMTSQEGFYQMNLLNRFLNDGAVRSRWNDLAPVILDYNSVNDPALNVTEVTQKITKFYFGLNSSQIVKEARIAAAIGDRFTDLPALSKSVKLHSKTAPTYAYIFGFKGKYQEGRGVGSGEDLFYYFNSSTFRPGFRKNDLRELSLSEEMTGFLASFAASGEPLCLSASNSNHNHNPRLWEFVNLSKGVQFLQLNNKDIKMIPQPFKKRIRFWESLRLNHKINR